MPTIIGSPYKKLDWQKDGFKKPWVSRKYLKPETGEIVHDLRCDICGKWYNYTTKDIPNIIREGRWNIKTGRPHHCGNSLCVEYYRRYAAHLWKKAEEIARQCYPAAFKGGK